MLARPHEVSDTTDTGVPGYCLQSSGPHCADLKGKQNADQQLASEKVKSHWGRHRRIHRFLFGPDVDMSC